MTRGNYLRPVSSCTSSDTPGPPDGRFTATNWNLVLLAGREDTARAEGALAELCRRYWYPLYAYVRRTGRSPEDAEDLTQEFFARLLGKQWLTDADQTKGRFRTFLLTAMQRFLAVQRRDANTLKRGRSQVFIPLDAATAEERYQLEPVDTASPDKLYERRWAMTLLDSTLAALREEMVKDGHGERFAALQPCLVGGEAELPYAELAERFALTESSVKSIVRRMRLRYRELLRAEVASTVAHPAETDAELKHLFAALRT